MKMSDQGKQATDSMSDDLETGGRVAPPDLDRSESVLDKHADPFATREGKTLLWKDINMTLVRSLFCGMYLTRFLSCSNFYFLCSRATLESEGCGERSQVVGQRVG